MGQTVLGRWPLCQAAGQPARALCGKLWIYNPTRVPIFKRQMQFFFCFLLIAKMFNFQTFVFPGKCFKTRNKGRIKRGQALAGSHEDEMVQDEEYRLAAPSDHPLPCQPSLVLTSASSQKCCSLCLSTELRDRQSLPLRSEQQQAPVLTEVCS